MRRTQLNRDKIEKMQLWYPLVMLGLGIVQQMVVQWVVFFYAPPTPDMTVYLSVGQISMAMVLGRIVDGAADPFIAYFSDRATFKFGRRRPFMILGFPFLLLSFILVWRPPVDEVSALNLVWAAVMLSLFFFAYSTIVVPYLAILPELARNDGERVRLATLQTALYGAGVGLGFIVSTTLSPLIGFPLLSLLVIPLAAFCILVPLWSIKEDSQGDTAAAPSWRMVFSSLKGDYPFLFWILTQGLVWSSFTIIVMVIPYLGSAVLGITSLDDVSIPLGIVFLLIAGFGVSAAFHLLNKIGKDAVYRGSLLAAGFILALFSLQVFQITPALFLAALVFSLAAGPLVLLFVLPNAVVAELAEQRRKLKKERWEALLYAAQGIIVKLSMAGGAAMFGVLLHFGGATAEDPRGIYISFLVSGVLLLIAALVFHKFLKLKEGVEKL